MKQFMFGLLCLLALLNTAFGNTKQSALDQDDSLLIPSEQIILTMLHKLNAPEDSSIARTSLVQLLTAESLKENHTTHSQPIVIGSEIISWDKVQLFPSWKKPVGHARKLDYVIKKSGDTGNYLLYSKYENVQKGLRPNLTYMFVALLNFWFFWIIRKKSRINQFHPLGWTSVKHHFVLLGYINLMTLFPIAWSVLVSGIGGLLISIWITTFSRLRIERRDSEDHVAWMILIMVVFAAIWWGLLGQLHLTAANFNRVHLNLLLISYTVLGNLVAWLLLMIGKLIERLFKTRGSDENTAIQS